MDAEKEKPKRRFVSFPVSPDEYDALQALVVAETGAKKVPVTKTEVIRRGLNMVAAQVIGQQIFEKEVGA